MAKKRVNYKFLILLGLPLVLLVGLAVAYKTVPQLKWLIRGTPQSHAEAAKKLYDQGKYGEAKEKYLRAVQLKNANDAAWLTAAADCYNHLTAEDPSNLAKMRGLLAQAIGTNPNYEPALRQQLQTSVDIAEQSRRDEAPRSWTQVADDAAALLRALPNDGKGLIAQNRAVIQLKLIGGRGTSEDFDKAIATLAELSRKDPFDADALTYALQGKLGKINDQVRSSDRAAAAKTAGDGLALLDEALKAHADSALLHLRAATFLGPLMAFAGETDAAKIGTRLLGEAETANKLVQPGDPHYVDAKLAYARVLQQAGKADQVAPIFDQVIQARPSDVAVRLVYAEFLSQVGKPADGIKVLDNIPPPKPEENLGMQGMLAKSFDLARLSQQLNLQLQLIPTLDADEQAKLLKTMDEEYARFTVDTDQTPQALFIRGQMELAKNKTVDAVQTLNKALSVAGGNSNSGELDLSERVMFSLAQANLRTQQTARAKELLQRIVSDANRFLPARLLLTRTLLAEHNPASLAEAKTHLDFLAKALPGSPEIARMRVMTYDKNVPAERKELEKTLADFPQDTTVNTIEKARLASFLDHPDQAVKLLEALNAKPDAGPEIAAALADAYASAKQNDKAVAVIDAALAKNADQPQLKMLRAKFAGEDLVAVSKELALQQSDPFKKEMALYQVAAAGADAQQMLAHLDAAEKLQPDNGQVKDLIFQIALRRGDFARAEPLVAWLSDHNQDQAGGLIFRTRLATAKAMQSPGAEHARELANALDLAQQLTKKLPEFAESWVVLGQVQMTLENFPEAEQAFAAALARQGENADALTGQIDAVERQGKFDYLKTLLTDARTRLPSNARLYEQQLNYELNHGDPEKTIAPRETQLKNVLAAKGEPSQAYYQLAQAYLVTASRREGDAAKQYYEKVIATASDALKVNAGFGELAAMSADASLQVGRFDQGLETLKNFQQSTDASRKDGAAMVIAQYYGRGGKAAEQEKALRDLLATSPNFLPARILLANLLAQQNRLDDALTLLPKEDAQPDILKQRVELLTNAGRYDQAKEEISAQLAATNDPSTTLLNQQARVLAATGHDADGAMAVLEKVLAKEPGNIDAKYYRAKIRLARGGNLQQSINDLRDVLRSVNNYDVRLTLAAALRDSGDLSGAIQAASETIPLRPAAAEPRLMLVQFYTSPPAPRYDRAEAVINDALKEQSLAHNPQLLNAAAQLWLNPNHKDPVKALSLVNDALKQLPDNPRLKQTQLQALIAARKPKDVLSVSQPMLDAKQPPSWVYNYRGQARAQLDDKSAALDEYSAGITAAQAAKDGASVNILIDSIARDIGIAPAKNRITPLAEKGDPRWQLILSSLYQRDHDLASAKTWVERILVNESSLEPDILFAARTQAGQLYLLSDPPDAPKAIAIYNKLLQSDPNDLNALNNLANTMILPGSGTPPAEAQKIAKRAADQVNSGGAGLAQYKPYVFDTLGWTQVLTGDANGAIGTLKESIDARPLPDSFYHLGVAYQQSKPPQIDLALSAFKQAQDLLSGGDSADASLAGKITEAIARAGNPTTAPNPAK